MTLRQFLSELKLERIDKLIFRGQSINPGWGRLFGGHVLGQALSAAQQTVKLSRPVHSCHSYFIRPGCVKTPVLYDIEEIRDGRSMSTRRVTAIQNGKPILYMTASFEVKPDSDQPTLEFQYAKFPFDVAPPESLLPFEKQAEPYRQFIPKQLSKRFFSKHDIRPVKLSAQPFGFEPCDPVQHVWIKASDNLPKSDLVHQCVSLYASDMHLLATCLFPHGKSVFEPDISCATVDHSMWFHKPCEISLDDDWILYSAQSPITHGGRGLSKGQFFKRDGELIATTMQEGIVRLTPNQMNF